MKEIGEFLKNSRIENGVSIGEASEDLGVVTSEIENLEEGNIKAFKDIYYLKNLVKEYSKYLGQDPDYILDEFNDFMYEHTSKISLDDIKEARKNMVSEEKPKVVSPYTRVKKEKIKIDSNIVRRVVVIACVVVFLMLVLFILRHVIHNEKTINTELKGVVIDEYTY